MLVRMSLSSASTALGKLAREEAAPDGCALVDACRAGEEAAWRRLITARAGQVYRWAVLLGLGVGDAEDAAQDVFAVAARRIGSCRADRALTSWLFQITRRVCANHRRRAWWRRWVGLSSADVAAFEPPVTPTGANELAVRACLERLPPRLAEVLVLLDIDELTREEAAAALGIPAGTVASRLRLAREAFERLWNEEPAR
jgi:RNA polymerase sigma-70 factor (ECF subfamily)